MLIKGCIALLVCAAPASVLAAEVMVTNTNDSGAGSLRDAVLSATSGDTINFAASLNGKTILIESTITTDKNISFAVPDNVTIIIDGADGVGPLLSDNASTVLDFSGAGLVIKNGNHSQSGSSANAYGGGVYADSITTLAGEVSGNTAIATCNTGNAYASGGAVRVENNSDTLSGQLSGNTVSATSDTGDAYAAGGAVRAYSINTLAGEVSGNTASAISDTGDAEACGGGVRAYNINTLSGEVSGNTASATSNSGIAFASGGGMDAYTSITTLSGEVSSNIATATSGTGDAEAHGGGVSAWDSIDTLSGQVSGNTASAVTNGTGSAESYGGGVDADSITTLSGEVSGNNTNATSDTGDAYAAGGGVFAANSIDTLLGQISGNTASDTSNSGDVYAAGGGVAVGWYAGTADAWLGTLSGQISGNTAIATSSTGSATVYGGGVRVWDSIDTLSGQISGNIASATVTYDTGDAQASGGGVDADSITTLAGEVSGNSATATSGTGDAEAYGGGVCAWDSIDTLSGQISGNTAIATSDSGHAEASGGGVDADSITTLSGEVSGNTTNATSGTSYASAAGGGVFADSITTLSGKVSDNTAVATSATRSASAYGGGVDANSITILSGEVSGNTTIATSATRSASAYGGGVYAGNSITTLSGQISDNTVFATSDSGSAQAYGGGVNAGGNSITTLSGQISDNTAIATSDSGSAQAYGGGVRANSITTLSGEVSGNTAIATSDSGSAQTYGGGMMISLGFDTLSGQISDNTTIATVTSGSGEAYALGGGAYIFSPSDITIRQGLFENNRAIASGNTDSRAEGGALFLNTTFFPASLTLEPIDGDIIFRNNTVSANATTTANDLAFGRFDLTFSSAADASLKIGKGPYNVRMAGGVTVDMNNGKSFSMTREGFSGSGDFLWGGNNVFTTSGGRATVNLASGTTTLEPDFNLEGNNLSFKLGQDALLQVKPAAQPAAINAASITLEASSRLALDDSSFVHGPVLTPGQNHMLLTMMATESFNDQGAALHNAAGTLRMGAYDYQYNLVWNNDSAGGKLSFTPRSRSFVPERGGAYATQASLYTALANKTSSVIFDRQGDRFRHLEQSSPDERLWAAPFYHTVRTDSQGSMAGSKINNPGIILGYDKKISDQSFMGGAASLSRPDYDAGGSRAEGNDVRLFIYGGTKTSGGLELSYAAGYGRGSLDQNRAIYGQSYDANYHNNTYTLGLGIAKPSVHKNITVKPYLSYEYLGIKTDAYSEGEGTYALGFGEQRQDVHLLRFGADLIRENHGGFVRYGLFYLGNYGDRRGQTSAYFTADPANPFTSVGAPLDQNNLGLSIGIGRAINEATDFSLHYAALLGSKGSSQNANLNLTYKF